MKILKKLKNFKERIKRIIGYIITPYKNWIKNGATRRRTRYAHYYKTLKVKEKTVLYESFFGRGLVCNPYALFLEMLKDDFYKDYTHIWVLENLNEPQYQLVVDEYKKHKNVKFVVYQSREYIKALASASILINNTTFVDYFIKKNTQTYINTWHGIPLKHLGYDMLNGATESKNVYRSLLQSDYLLSANSFLTSVYKNSYKINEIYKGSIIQEGYPRNDLINSNREYVLTKLKKHGLSIDGSKKIILYAPTWRGNSFSKPSDNVYELINFTKGLLNSIDSTQYQILLKPHNALGKLFKELDFGNYIIPSTFDAGETLSITDILISDFSSIYFDFLTTNRPLIFYIPDEKEYKEERGIYFGLDELPSNYTNDISIVAGWINNIDTFQKDNASQYQKVRDFCENSDKPNISKQVLDIIIKGDKKGHIITPNPTKKRILMFKGSPLLNGVGTSANNLLNYIDYSKYDVTLCMHAPSNQEQIICVNTFSSNCHILIRVSTFSATLLEQVKINLSNEYCQSFKLITKMFPKNAYKREVERCFGNTEFDYIVDFDGYSRMFDLLALEIPVKKRYVWQHNDMHNEKEVRFKWLNHLFTLYRYFDGIVSCAEPTMQINQKNLNYLGLSNKFTYVTNLFDSKKVELAITESTYIELDDKFYYKAESTNNKIRFIPLETPNLITTNKLDMEETTYLYDENDNQITQIGKKWKNGIVEWNPTIFTQENLEKQTKFITVGRSSPEKNHIALIDGFALLLKEYPNILLYIVGYGKDYMKEYNYILKKKLQYRVIMTNNIKNPFGLMQKCDCFILPSLHEGCPMVITEARMLNMPIIMTDFDTVDAVSMENGQLIIKKDKNSIYLGMKGFIEGKVPCDYKFDADEYNKKCYSEFEVLFKD